MKKKKNVKRLSLHRETLGSLEAAGLAQAHGAVSLPIRCGEPPPDNPFKTEGTACCY